MKLYYNGKLIKNGSSNKDTFKLFYDEKKHNIINSDELNTSEIKFLKKEFKIFISKKTEILSPKIIDILNKFHFSKFFCGETNIIFEKIEDIDGNLYGKEIITGIIFPLNNNPNNKYFYDNSKNYELTLEKTYTNSNLARFEVMLYEYDIASINEINSYKNRYLNDMELMKKRKEELKKLFNENVFNKEITIIEQEPLQKQNEHTKIMEDIEYILGLLKNLNEKFFNKHNNEYKSILDDYNNYLYSPTPLKEKLLNLLSNVKLSLMIDEQKSDNIQEYLNIIIEKYLNKIINNNIDIEDININDLDNLTEIFLKNKDNYTLQIQRDVLIKISLLYLLIVKTNIDNINNADLENSYFKDNIKTIILNIITLSELGIINNNFNIYSLKDTSIKNILNIIKNINFNKIKQEQIKELIKSK